MNVTSEMTAAFEKAKVQFMMLKNTAFITTILFHLKLVWDDTISTAGTDGLTLYINPIWFLQLSHAERVGLLAHECWHVAWNHMARGEGLDHGKYNIAGDHIINITITDSGMKIPADGYCDYQYRDMGTRQIYDLLPDKSKIKVNWGGDDVIYVDPKKEGADKAEEKKLKIRNILVAAKNQSILGGDSHGSIPQEIERMIDELIDPVLSWEILLANFMDGFASDDYTMTKPNKYYLPDFYIPSQYSERIGNVAAAIDLSGSITKKMLTAFLSELNYIQETMNPENMEILGFNTRVVKTYQVSEEMDIMDINFKGGGGTRITPVLEHYNETKPIAAIIFTDMQFENYTVNLEFPVIWIIIDNPRAIPKDGVFAHYSTRSTI